MRVILRTPVETPNRVIPAGTRTRAIYHNGRYVLTGYGIPLQPQHVVSPTYAPGITLPGASYQRPSI